MDKKLNVMSIKLNLDISETTEKLNRCEDQIDRILEKQKHIGSYSHNTDIEQLANELTFFMKQHQSSIY